MVNRERRITVGGINIVTHPHSTIDYARLIRRAFELKSPIAVYGEQRLLMSSCFPEDERHGLITGTIARFTELSPDLPWFNSEKLDKADDSDINRINIPEGLKPNYVSFFYAFDPITHTLAFEQKLGNFTISSELCVQVSQ